MYFVRYSVYGVVSSISFDTESELDYWLLDMFTAAEGDSYLFSVIDIIKEAQMIEKIKNF